MVTLVQVNEGESTRAFLLTAQFEETPKSKSSSAISNTKPQPTMSALSSSFERDGQAEGCESPPFERGDTTCIFASIL